MTRCCRGCTSTPHDTIPIALFIASCTAEACAASPYSVESSGHTLLSSSSLVLSLCVSSLASQSIYRACVLWTCRCRVAKSTQSSPKRMAKTQDAKGTQRQRNFLLIPFISCTRLTTLACQRRRNGEVHSLALDDGGGVCSVTGSCSPACCCGWRGDAGPGGVRRPARVICCSRLRSVLGIHARASRRNSLPSPRSASLEETRVAKVEERAERQGRINRREGKKGKQRRRKKKRRKERKTKEKKGRGKRRVQRKGVSS